jgi:hypothetical protein
MMAGPVGRGCRRLRLGDSLCHHRTGGRSSPTHRQMADRTRGTSKGRDTISALRRIAGRPARDSNRWPWKMREHHPRDARRIHLRPRSEQVARPCRGQRLCRRTWTVGARDKGTATRSDGLSPELLPDTMMCRHQRMCLQDHLPLEGYGRTGREDSLSKGHLCHRPRLRSSSNKEHRGHKCNLSSSSIKPHINSRPLMKI